jgi:hypothetical protein
MDKQTNALTVVLKFIAIICSGFALSWILYPLTHHKRQIPELAGIVVGVLDGFIGWAWLGGDTSSLITGLAAFGGVGLGVTASRWAQAAYGD